MAVQQTGTIRRYIGLSTDPEPQLTTTDRIPAGSELFFTDTFQTARFDGATWRHQEQADGETVEVLREVVVVLQEIKTLLIELHG
jgi:hypothetical protein